MKKCIIFVISVSAIFAAVVCFLVNAVKEVGKKYISMEDSFQKNAALFHLMISWMRRKIDGENIADILFEKGFRRIIIYGMGEVGQLLAKELEHTNVEVVCGMDRSRRLYSGIKVLSPNDPIPNADAIVVTPITYYETVKSEMLTKTDISVISLKELL